VEVSPNPEWNWVPSNVWVGVGQMAEKEVTFDLAEIYKKKPGSTLSRLKALLFILKEVACWRRSRFDQRQCKYLNNIAGRRQSSSGRR